jgi:hypothetical protein
MQKIARRKFCESAIMAFPLLSLYAKDRDARSDPSDPVSDALTDEIIRITAEGAQNGFKAEHFRRYAGVIRALDAHLEGNGTNRELNSRLEEDDSYKMNPALGAQITLKYWKKKGVYLNEGDLTARLTMNRTAYMETKMAIKKQGGVRVVHQAIADAFERKAKEFETVAFRGGPVMHNGHIAIRGLDFSRQPEFMNVQYDFRMYVGLNLDCLCKAMVIEGEMLMIACLLCPGCQALCIPAGILLATEKLMEAFGMCVPTGC